jgi:hypothetical protein
MRDDNRLDAIGTHRAAPWDTVSELQRGGGMRNISFMLTPDQIRAGTKTVTRRMGWRTLKPGELLQPVKKGMGLEKIERLRGPLRVTSVQQEPLRMLLDSPIYGQRECVREGFPDYTPASFIDMFCRSHKGCTPESLVTRIEFEYLPDVTGQAPIALLTVNEAGEVAGVHMYAPGLPPGDHELYCEPAATAPYLRDQPGAGQ